MQCLKHRSFRSHQGPPFCSKHTRSLADTLRVQAGPAEEYFAVTKPCADATFFAAVLCENV